MTPLSSLGLYRGLSGFGLRRWIKGLFLEIKMNISGELTLIDMYDECGDSLGRGGSWGLNQSH